MQNVKRRLLSLNFAILMLLTVIFPAGAVGVSPSAEGETHQYEQYISIDGTEYDATEDHSGDGWSYWYDDGDYQLELENYHGGSILANTSLDIECYGENVISGSTYGIDTPDTVWLTARSSRSPKSTLVVNGAQGYEAIHTDYIYIFGNITATGGNCAAISANNIDDWFWHWPHRILVGNSPEDAAEGTYTNQPYVSFEQRSYEMTLHGNGGISEDGDSEMHITNTRSNPGYFHLYPYFDVFTKNNRLPIGWTDDADDTSSIRPIDEYYQYPDNTYTADLYAVWEDTNYKAVVLENYYGMYANHTKEHRGDTLPIAVKTGDTYTLPEQVRSGCKFDGWLAEDDTLYPAGTVFTVTESMTLTAKFTALELKIDGKTYDASRRWNGDGWSYYPHIEEAQLDVYNSYSGLPIEVPTTADIRLYKSMSAESGIASIVVHGDLFLYCNSWADESDNPITIIGGENAPAIRADGQVSISVYNYDDNFKLILKSGGVGVPAIKAASVKCHAKMFYAGTDAANTSVVYRYSNEEYAEITEANSYIITVTGRCTLPELPEFDDEIAVSWRNTAIDRSESRAKQLWYMPGDEIDAGDGVTIEAKYISGNGTSTAMIIDGHGGTMVSGSRYYVDYASTNALSVYYYYPSNPFTNTGKTFLGYNTAADGSGTMYQPGDRFAATDLVQKYYAQWKTESSGSTGGGGGGGGASAPSVSGNSISAPSTSNGTVSLDKTTAKKGDTVTVTVTPNTGFTLDKLTVTDAKGNALTVSDKGNGKFTFVMPDGKVTVTPTFAPVSTVPDQSTFSDIVPGEWYVDAVQYITEKGLMNGTGNGRFSPDSSTTRAMLMTVLARHAGEDTTGSNPWYEKGMNWAKANGVSDGTNPEVNITREQLVTMLYRYAGSPAANGSLNSFSDADSVSAYAVTAMQWAVEKGIVNGSNGHLNPQSNATRAEIAAILMRFCEQTKN